MMVMTQELKYIHCQLIIQHNPVGVQLLSLVQFRILEDKPFPVFFREVYKTQILIFSLSVRVHLRLTFLVFFTGLYLPYYRNTRNMMMFINVNYYSLNSDKAMGACKTFSTLTFPLIQTDIIN